MPGRGLLTVACLVLIALVCISVVRTLERQRRLLRKLRTRGALDGSKSVSLDELSEDEQDSVESLAAASVLIVQQRRCYIRSAEIPVFRRKRVRLALSGGFAALILAVLVAVLILRR